MLISFFKPVTLRNGQTSLFKAVENGLLGAVGVMVKQDLSKFANTSNGLVLLLLMLNSLFFSSMYASIVTAMLTAKVEVDSINKLEDLLLPQFQHLSIMSQVTMEARFKEWPIYDKIKDRLLFYDMWAEELNDFEKIVSDVAEGRQVLIDDWFNLNGMFQQDLPFELSCKYPISGYTKSADVIPGGNLPATWIYRKGFKYAEVFDKARMWLEAYGIFAWGDSMTYATKTDNAIFVPEIVDIPCSPLPERPPTNGCPPSITDEPITLTHIRKLLLYYACGMGLSVFVFVLEHVFSKLSFI